MDSMTSSEIRNRFLKFFEERGHTKVPSSSLVPEGDASVLFTTAGMQQFKPYYIGKKSPETDFNSKNTTSVQKCVRTSDIEEVGDERHLTFFEMLGNFSFGGPTSQSFEGASYWKQEAIGYAYDFVTKEMGLTIDYVTVFEGREGVPHDLESENIWKNLDPKINIKRCGMEDNFWGPTGEEGPCGPTTEIYVDGIEIWNIVFNEFYQNKDKTLVSLEKKGIDTGMGLERLAKVVQKVPTVFDTDLFDYMPRGTLDTKQARIVADHVRTSVFMIADGVRPSNSERGYVLRRLLRRALVNKGDLIKVASAVFEKYKDIYELGNKEEILDVIKEEADKFAVVLKEGMKEFDKLDGDVNGEVAFRLVSSYGFPIEIIEELARDRGINVDRIGFDEEFRKHQRISKSGMEQKFKGGLAGHSDMEVKYHTATHLLHQALRDVLGDGVQQKGSNITPERLRFDFSHPQKMTDEEKKKVEDIVNERIKSALPVQKVILPKEEAEKVALHFFGDKYGDEVSVYYIGDSLDTAYSKEFCGGPHIDNTSELGAFKIQKEEAVSAGVRRIKAVLQ